MNSLSAALTRIKSGLERIFYDFKIIIPKRHEWRENPVGQIWLCLMLGILVGIVTGLLHEFVLWSHRAFFALPAHGRLSSAEKISPFLIAAIPAAGGLILGLFNFLSNRFRATEIVDPIEANAVYGGRMSLIDSTRLVIATLISNAAGVSIGMEAAYTQMGAGITSWAGRYFGLRRDDMRIFVAAGAAAAIAGAFNAPLAGAFYAFELVLGTYTVSALPQVAIAALSSVTILRIFSAKESVFSLSIDNVVIPPWFYLLFIGMGIFAASIGILTMKAVTKCENISKKSFIPGIFRPAAGGILISLIALFVPQILGSGQGAINVHLHHSWPALILALMLAAKIFGSAISIGFGFRGGLFSASLFIGCLFGQLFGTITSFVLPETAGQAECFMLVGMGAVAASIVGAPITIVLLVLEMTESFAVTVPVMAAVLVSSVVTRYSFGYSFSTWRFHLRGLRITGAHDIGWIRDLTVGSLMQAMPKTALSTLTVAALRAEMPAGSTARVFLIDDAGKYQGSVDVAQLHGHDLDSAADTMTAAELAKGKDRYLVSRQNIKEALDLFSLWELEDLPVLDTADGFQLTGYLSEAYALKRYARELEARNLAQSGAAAPQKAA